MSDTALASGFLVIFLLNLAAGGFLFWLTCRVCRVPRVSYWRALAVQAVLTAYVLLVEIGHWYSADQLPGIVLFWLAGLLAGIFLILKRGFRIRGGKTIVVALVGFLLNAAVSFAVAFAIIAWLAEAFAVSSGSMATTLLGAHHVAACDRCALSWPVGASDYRGPLPSARCPNCSAAIRLPQDEPIVAGDRMLADKDSKSKRWDLIVFKNPADGVTPFVDRLVGLPGEVVEIIDGDIYTASLESLRAAGFPLEELDRLRLEIHRHGQAPQGGGEQIIQTYEDLNRQLAPHLQIQRKAEQAPAVQERLWITVHDHDRAWRQGQAAGPLGSLARWTPDGPEATAAWNAAQPEIALAQAEGTQYLVFGGKPIDDWLAYNGSPSWLKAHPVGDIRLRLTWLPGSAEGSIVLQANRDQDTFEAEVRADGVVALRSLGPHAPEDRQVLEEMQLPAFAVGQAVRITFTNVDYRVNLAIDGRTVVASTDQQYAPDTAALLSRLGDDGFAVQETKVRIGARGACRLRQVILDRDIYYRQIRQMEAHSGTARQANPYLGWPGWGTAGMPILLRPARQSEGRNLPAEYFLLGDNSAWSKDSRLWWQIGPRVAGLGAEYQPGTIPDDHLTGVVRWIYWPPERWSRFQ